MDSCVPPGFRFHPTDEELVGYYLRKKVASQKIDLDVIRDIDLYSIEPWDLRERCRIGYEEEHEWYFFSHRDKKYPTGTRTNRATMAGFWKATGRDKSVYENGRLIGMRKTLVFYRGRAPNGCKTEWIMHEYRLESDIPPPASTLPYAYIVEDTRLIYREEGWVVCRAFRKRTNGQTKNMESWEEDGRHSSLSQPADRYLSRQTRELQIRSGDRPSFMNFEELPPRPASDAIEEEEELRKATDWRTLDKFVASQLSQEALASNGAWGGAPLCDGGDEHNNVGDYFIANCVEIGSNLI